MRKIILLFFSAFAGITQWSYAQTITTHSVASPLCHGASIPVGFSITGTFNAGNIFTAELSDASGSFASATPIGTLAGTTSSFINATIPGSVVSGAGYRIRVVSSNPVVNGANNGSNIEIDPLPSVSLYAVPQGVVCVGTSFAFIATVTNPGSGGIIYNFQVNGSTVQSGPLNSYSSFTLNDDDIITCTISSATLCGGFTNVTSNAITLSVSSSITPTLSLATVPPGPMCSGGLLVFVATATGTSGGTVNYDFKVNGVTRQNSGSNTFVIGGLVNGDVVSCILTISGPPCLTSNTAYSNNIVIFINPMSTPGVSIVANQPNPICSGTTVTFTATSYGLAGGTANYDFKINGVSVQNGPSNTFTTNSLSDGDTVTCTITVSGGTCLTTNIAWSNVITMTVNPIFSPSVTISGTPIGSVCPGTLVTITAIASNTGTASISYDFQINGISVQNGPSNTYSSSTLNNGDVITCTINVSALCLTANYVMSNSLVMGVSTAINPSVSLAASPSGPVCLGTPITFTASVSSASGGSVNYDFKVNGVSVQNGPSNLFTTGSLASGDAVTCTITVTGVTCLASPTATSNIIIVAISTNLTPTVSMVVNPAGPICSGTTATFTATANGTSGGTVSYDFIKNGVTVQSGPSDTYTTNNLVNGDIISCTINITGGTCLLANTANSNSIQLVVNPTLNPSVSIVSSQPGPICAGTSVTFTATAGNTGGGTVSYDFKINGTTVQSNASNIFISGSLNNGDVVSCSIIITGGTCVIPNSASSNVISMTVNPVLTPTLNIVASPAGPVCAGTPVTFTATATSTGTASLLYEFKLNGNIVQSSGSNSYSSAAFVNGDVVTCTVILTGGTCLSSNTVSSNSITISINANLTPTVSLSSSLPGPICAGSTVTFTATTASTGGGTVNYDFKLNGSTVQSGSSNSFVTSTLNHGDIISCTINVTGTSCLTVNSSVSNDITMGVNPVLTPTITIAANLTGPVCSGTAVTFTATAGNTGGASLLYDFKINGTSVQSSSSNSFTTTVLANGDIVSCALTLTGGTCLSSNTALSNSIPVTVNANETPTVSISSNIPGPICTGTSVTFTAVAANTIGGTLSFDFKINGTSVQNGASNVFSTNALVNGDAVTCTINITGGTCLTTNTATSNAIIWVVTASLSPSVSISSDQPGPICAGTSVTFTASASNTSAGTVNYDFKVNGTTVQSSTSNTFTTSTLSNGDNISCEINITGGTCLASNTSSSNVITVNVNPILNPAVTIAANPSGPLCAGTLVNFTATASGTGSAILNYHFYKNGISVQNSSSPIFSSSSLADGDNITCEINITGGTCLSSNTANSNIITISVNPLLTPTSSISVMPAGPVCAGTTLTFTATAANTGTASINYNFRINGVSIQNSASNLFTTNILAQGDVVTCIITLVGENCLTANSALSNSLTAMVIPMVTPTLSITSSPAGPVCAGTPVNFVATSSNTGSGTIIYDFKINGTSVQSGSSSSFTCSTLNNGDEISCVMTLGGSCLTLNTVTSNLILMTVNPVLTPTINLGVSPAGPVCAGSQLIFTATSGSLGGGTVIYDFKVNGSTMQSGSSPVFNTSSLSNGDIVTCTLSINGGTCITTTNLSSNPITAVVNPNITPSVSIAVDQPGPVCSGTNLTFTAQALNTGTGTKMYNFKKNGSSVQNSSSNTYSTTSLVDGDVITCRMTVSGVSCLVNNIANANPIAVEINAGITPAVNINIQPAGPVCAGTPVSITATPSNISGGSVNYDFKVNGTIRQSGSSNVYTSSTFSNGDDIRCDITVAGASCLTQSMVASNEIEINVNPSFSPVVSLVTVPSGPVCPGTMIRYIATAANTGSAAVSYEFKINGSTVQSGPANTYASDVLKINDRVTCVINLSGGSCLTENAVTSAVVKPDISNEACPNKFYIPNGFTPNQDGRNDLFRPVIFGKVASYRFVVYNRWGQKVFESTELNKGWDGKQFGTQSDSNVFVWVCTFTFEGGQPEIRKGTVALIR